VIRAVVDGLGSHRNYGQRSIDLGHVNIYVRNIERSHKGKTQQLRHQGPFGSQQGLAAASVGK
jgi:hypothetical protein